MINLLDRESVKNVVKYYSFMDKSRTFKNGEVLESSRFDKMDYDFDLNYQTWSNNKAGIFKLFGNKLKVVKDLGGKNLCSDNMARDLTEEFLRNEGKGFSYPLKTLITFLKPSEISSNILSRNIEFLGESLRKGWKVTKCFSRIELDKARLDEQLDIYSTFLQSLYVKGRLVLSIDPLDYITMSVSRSGWSSCHHPNAEYGTGGLAYMNDRVSIIAYVETEQPMTSHILDSETGIKHKVEMPNKIWRQVITLNESHDYALQLSEYPNDAPIYRDEAGKLLINLLSAESDDTFIKHKIDYKDDRVCLQESNVNLDCYIFYCDYSNHNFRSITCLMKKEHENTRVLSNKIREGEVEVIVVGEEVYCACGCGEENYTSSMYVEDCDAEDHRDY